MNDRLVSYIEYFAHTFNIYIYNTYTYIHYSTLHCITLHYIAYIALHFITFQYIFIYWHIYTYTHIITHLYTNKHTHKYIYIDLCTHLSLIGRRIFVLIRKEVHRPKSHLQGVNDFRQHFSWNWRSHCHGMPVCPCLRKASMGPLGLGNWFSPSFQNDWFTRWFMGLQELPRMKINI